MKTSKLLTQSLLTILLLYPVILFGQTQKQQRETRPFTGVSTTGISTVYITQADTFSVVVESLPEFLDDIETIVRNNMLEIKFSGRTGSSGDIKIYATAPHFERLIASGASSFISTNMLSNPALSTETSGASNMNLEVNTDHLTTKVSGASTVTLSGQTIKHNLTASGACLVRGYELVTEVTEAAVSGASSVRITANEVLNVEASGTSSLSYRGKPASKDISASGLTSIHAVDIDETAGSESVTDTVVVRLGEREIQVIDSDEPRPRVSVSRKQRKPSFRDNWTGVELGINGLLSPDNSITLPAEAEQFDLQYNKSIALNLNFWQQNLVLVRGHLALITGVGIGWNNYRFTTNDLLVKGPQEIEHEPGLYDYKKNKLTMTLLHVPLLLEFQTSSRKTSEKFHLAAGINLGLRLSSHTKQMVFIDGDREKFKEHNDFYLNPFRYDATVRIGWGYVNLFATYSLNPLFKEGKGPEIYPFSAGIRINTF